MPQLTIEGLRKIKEETASQMALREGRPEGGGTIRHHLLICAGLACITCGSLKVRERLEKELKDRGLENKVKVVITGCAGLCAEGPLMLVYPEGTFYRKLTPEDVSLIVEEHILKGKPVEKLFYRDPTRKVAIPRMKDIPFFGNQHLRVLRNQG
ncbi:MAG: (2Fe-2S) ferredoxin domain-containing protein, partial [Deltaproteobacteria bacterium]|nr:(2Fe-2S) ferredoxin domain-containing protein [Deltaproteobacteria bacterium]